LYIFLSNLFVHEISSIAHLITKVDKLVNEAIYLIYFANLTQN